MAGFKDVAYDQFLFNIALMAPSAQLKVIWFTHPVIMGVG